MCLGQQFALSTRQSERKLVHPAGSGLELGATRFDEHVVVELGRAQVFQSDLGHRISALARLDRRALIDLELAQQVAARALEPA